MNSLIKDINLPILGILSMMTSLVIGGCATPSSFSSLMTDDPSLKSRYYAAPYDKVINAAVEAASKTRTCKVQDVDEAQGLITAADKDVKRTYVMKIHVKEAGGGQIRVDVGSYTPSDIKSENIEFIREFLEKLDILLIERDGKT